MAANTLTENYAVVEDLFTPASYRPREGWRFIHDAKRHDHERLSATMAPPPSPYDYRHWVIQDMYDAEYVRRMLRLAADYGMNGIQFSGDNIYWVNDSLYRYNTYAFVGELCERCRDLGLQAWFWTHEINDFFHEFVTDGRYGYSGQLRDGKMDLSADSGYWRVLEEKYDVFFRRMPGVDGLVLTLNECHVPVFREGLIQSDLPAEERVARIARTVLDVCRRHGKGLILRTFCYFPDELAVIRAGLDRIDPDLPIMVKCQPHDWQIYFPHNPLIGSDMKRAVVVEYDLCLEFMGDGRFPGPQVDYLKSRMDHAAQHGAAGVAGRICRFRHHAEGTLNWANVYAFSRLARRPDTPADAIWHDYAAADFGADNADFITDMGRRLHEISKQVYYLAHELRGLSNYSTFPGLDQWLPWTCARWSPDDATVQARYRLLCAPTPAFIADVEAEKQAALDDLAALREEVAERRESFAAADFDYLSTVLERAGVMAEIHTTQHLVEIMVRHDAPPPPEQRRYTDAIQSRIARLRQIVATQRNLALDGGVEGNQHGDELVELFCRRALRYLGAAPKATV